MTPAQLTDHFRDLGRGPALSLPPTDLTSHTGPQRGDHDLNPDMGVRETLVPAAVLVPLVDRDDGLTMLFTQRTAHLATHPGQISFPGGHSDPEDGSAEDTALRETEEEVGLARHRISLIGRLDTYITRTGFSVVPVVGVIRPPFAVKPDPEEVADVFEVPLSFLMDPSNHQRHSRDYEGRRREFYAMPFGERYIWGATAGMIKNFYDILRDMV